MAKILMLLRVILSIMVLVVLFQCNKGGSNTVKALDLNAWSQSELSQMASLNDKLLYYFDTASTHPRFNWNKEGVDIFETSISSVSTKSRIFAELLTSLQMAKEKQENPVDDVKNGKLENLLSPTLKGFL